MSVMAEKGYQGVTVRDICERAEVSIGSFYRYFETKPDILQGMYESGDQLMQEESPELAGRPPAAELTELLFVCMRGMCYDWCISNGAYDLQERMTSQMSLLIRAFVP